MAIIVVILLLSGLPQEDVASPGRATPPATSAETNSSANSSRIAGVAANSHPPTPSPTTNPAFCVLHLETNCPGVSPGPVVSPTSQASSTASAWTNITPPQGVPNPSARWDAATVYYPSGHDVILFGGIHKVPSGNPLLGDTWAFKNNAWTELYNSSTCTPTTCPSPRAEAMLAYYPTDNALVLFGGLAEGGFLGITENDTWLFANDTWTNITSSAGHAPPARAAGAMSYDPSDNYIVLFGGLNAVGNALGDTWEFSDGTWTNLTTAEGGPAGYETNAAPEPRYGAAISDSPTGYVMLFGGWDSNDHGNNNSLIENSCENGTWMGFAFSDVAWWFHLGKWSQMTGWGTTIQGCPPQRPALGGPTPPLSYTPTPESPPCGRGQPALGWSPRNNRFVLYGGWGATLPDCSGPPALMDDTWTYTDTGGGTFLWNQTNTSTYPPAREEMGSASDFSDGYFEVFGGITNYGQVNETWRFFEPVQARLTGPSGTYCTANCQQQLFQIPWVVSGYGGSGNLTYSIVAQGLQTTNPISGNGCGRLNDSTPVFLPYNGTVNFQCHFSSSSFNVFRLTLTVVDHNDTSDFATSNWTITILPQERIQVYSQYVTYFFTNVNLENTFTVFAEVNNESATSLPATLGGTQIQFTHTSGNPYWWNYTFNMASATPGAGLAVTAEFPSLDWSLQGGLPVVVIATPSWLLSLFNYTGAKQSLQTAGAGPFNDTFWLNETYSWNLGSALDLNLSIPLIGGGYQLVPSLTVTLSACSNGTITLNGSLSLQPPAIDIGSITLNLSAQLSVVGSFAVSSLNPPTIDWLSASAIVAVNAFAQGTIPISGFSILGFTVGFFLTLQIQPIIILDMVLAPSTPGGPELIPGIQMFISQLAATFSVPLTVIVGFGVGPFWVGIGGTVTIEMALSFSSSLGVIGGWVNGSLFVEASAYDSTDDWDLVGPGTIFSWGDVGQAPRAGDAGLPDNQSAPVNNGTGTKWSFHDRYYVTQSYDTNVWDALDSVGPAISDIYPTTEVAGAAGYNGAYLFYTNDNSSQPVQDGIGISGARLGAATNELTALPAPSDPNYLIESPVATTLPDGSLYVLWDALPISEGGDANPFNYTSLALQGAPFYPNTDSWGPIRTFSTNGFAESYQVDATGTSGDVVELLSNTVLPANGAPERLVEYDLTNGNVVSNVSTAGVSEIVSFRSASGLAVVESFEGSYSVVSLDTGQTLSLTYSPPTHFDLVSSAFVQDSPSTLVMLYRGPTSSRLITYDTATGTTLGRLALGDDVLQAEGIANGNTDYVFVRTAQGIDGWTETGGSVANLTTVPQTHIDSYGLVQIAGSILLYSLVTTGGNSTQPVKTLMLAEVGASLPAVPVPSGVSTGPASSSPPTGSYLLYLGVIGGLVALLLAVVYITTRRRPPATSPPGPPASEGLVPPNGEVSSPPSPPDG